MEDDIKRKNILTMIVIKESDDDKEKLYPEKLYSENVHIMDDFLKYNVKIDFRITVEIHKAIQRIEKRMKEEKKQNYVEIIFED